MMKNALSLIMVIIILAGLSSCARISEKQVVDNTSIIDNNEIETSALPIHIGLTYAECYDPETDYDNRFGRCFGNIIETEDVYYIMFLHSQYLYYYDKATGEWAVLCGKPDCVHDEKQNNTDCNGFVGANIITLNRCNGRLYYSGQTGFDESPIASALYRMEPDGTEHTKLFPLDCDPLYAPQRLDLHRGKLYSRFMGSKVDEAEPEQYCGIGCWDIATGRHQVIYEQEGFQSTPFPTMFYFGKYVYFCISSSIGEGNRVQIFRWDTEIEELETLVDTGNKGYPGAYYTIWVDAEEKVYVAPRIGRIDVSGQAIVYIVDGNELKEAFGFEAGGMIDLIEGAAVCYRYNEETNSVFVSIKDYDGLPVYNGEWGMSFLDDIAPEAAFSGFNGLFGDKNSVFIMLSVRAKDQRGNKGVAIRYDIMGDEAERTLLCVADWQ